WPRALAWQGAIADTARASGAMPQPPPPTHTAGRCATSPKCGRSTSGTPGSISRSSSRSGLPGRARPDAKDLRRRSRKPGRKTACAHFAKLAHEVDGEPRIVSDPPLIVPIEQLALDAEPS